MIEITSRHSRQAAWLVAGVATVGSLSLSGLPALGWWGMGLAPCELCWYQRILMYPLVLLLGAIVLHPALPARWIVLPLAVPGAAIAAYHSLIQHLPQLEIGTCSVGTCTAQLWALGPFSIPNLSLIAFLLILGLTLTEARLPSGTGRATGRSA